MRSHPFPYFGEGSTRPIRAKDGLLSLVVFASPISRAEAKAIAASAPEPMQSFVKSGRRWLSLETTGKPPPAKVVTKWIEGVHRAHPVALFFVGSDGKRGAWHADTVKHFAERVRPVVEALREDGESDHAHWIATSFLREGATTSFEDIRALAEEDPQGYVGDVGRRCLLAMPLVEALGPASLSALGPYGELGFWACASITELVADLPAHARHLVALADACKPMRASAVQHLLVMAAISAMLDSVPLMVKIERPARTPKTRPESFEAALVLAGRAASPLALTTGLLEMLVDAARRAGGAAQAVAFGEQLLPATLAATNIDPTTPIEEQNLVRLVAITTKLAEDQSNAPSASLAKMLANAPQIEPPEQDEHENSTHPHLARLNTERLTVRYHGSLEPQRVVLAITGLPRLGFARHFCDAVRDVVALINFGLAGADVFAPELGHAKIVDGSDANDPGRDFRWTLDVRGVAPAFWAVALHLVANPRKYYSKCEAKECPKHISIVGDVPVDGSPASATTERMLEWLRDPTPAFRAFPEPPFAIKAEKPSKAAFIVKPERMHAELGGRVRSVAFALRYFFTAHPRGVGASLVGSPDVGKTQVKVSWFKTPLPSKVTRGPILNMARRLHFEVTPLSTVSLAKD